MTAFAALLFWLAALVPISAPNPRYLEVALAVVEHFPVEARQMAMCVAYYENRVFDPMAVSPTGDYGVMGINAYWQRERLAKMGLTPTDLFIVDTNVRVAADIWVEQRFSPWTTYWRYCR